ncbi:MAG: gldN [Bacteroidetes bacterium]|nr:MAG: gldN [Bacteroidota bacterium]
MLKSRDFFLPLILLPLMRRFTLFLLLLVLCFDTLEAQLLHDTLRKKITYTPLTDSPVMWYKYTWRTIDLEIKINKSLGSREKPAAICNSLFDVLKDALLKDSGRIAAYDARVPGDEFRIKLTPSEVQNLFARWDSMPNTDSGTCWLPAPLKSELAASAIRGYQLKEEWFFDKQRSALDFKIQGLCPVKEVYGRSGEIEGYSPLCWIYYPEINSLLAATPACAIGPTDRSRSTNDILSKRLFYAPMDKEQLTYDRVYEQHMRMMDTELLSGRIKNLLTAAESRLWVF